MTTAQSNAIREFFRAAERLKTLKVIRSDRYLGDIAEFICKDQFGLKLAASGRHPGYDGHIQGTKVQVKYAGGSSTTIDCGDPEHYDELLIVLGAHSVLRTHPKAKGFAVFRIPSAMVRTKVPHSDGRRRYTKRQLPASCEVQSSK
jgi:hypothetical protein